MQDEIEAAERAMRDMAEHCRRLRETNDSDNVVAESNVALPLSLEEWGPLYAFVVVSYQRRLRRDLVKIKYPSIPAELWEEADEDDDDNDDRIVTPHQIVLSSIQTTTHHDLALWHYEVSSYFQSNIPQQSSMTMNHSYHHPVVLQELCRPIVERVCFHFVPQILAQSKHQQPPPTTATRMDRLPEWLLGYLREHVFQSFGPWEWIVSFGILPLSGSAATTTASTSDDFVNEMIRLVQFVLAERNFFRDPVVCGPSSQPMVLCRAVEQLLQFDAFVQNDVLVYANGNSNNSSSVLGADPSTTLLPQRHRVVSLVDVCVAGDEELLAWWLSRERESVVATLFDDTAIVNEMTTMTTAITNSTMTTTMSRRRVSPRAELFCALIRSVRSKAATFTFSAPYMTHVASPLCMQFLDALHETATDLTRQLTTGKKAPKQSSVASSALMFQSRNQLPTNAELYTLFTAWIEMINGAQMAAQTLSSDGASSIFEPSSNESDATTSDEDMIRFGRSLERLQAVMLDDFVTSTVEVLILERAKMAGYLMRCSHLLASASEDYMVGGINTAKLCDLSTDLLEAHRIVAILLDCCGRGGESADNDDPPDRQLDDWTAPRMMRERVMSLLAEKLLEVALDLQGMTPDLRRPGCILFARDVVALLGGNDNRQLPLHALRVLDVVHLMRMDGAALSAMGNALCGLAGQAAPLTEADFEGDDRLFDEAISMIRAKGLIFIELADVFAVLNRRRDL